MNVDKILYSSKFDCINCKNCLRDLNSTLPFVKNITKRGDEGDTYLCLPCISAGVTVEEGVIHDTNDYILLNENLDFPIFSSNWTAGEELLMLEGLMDIIAIKLTSM